MSCLLIKRGRTFRACLPFIIASLFCHWIQRTSRYNHLVNILEVLTSSHLWKTRFLFLFNRPEFFTLHFRELNTFIIFVITSSYYSNTFIV
uniref:Secreted protein n=1 Tax=Rodentolepis nana TaxID=102285 RepID=A0A0R3TEV5_RODNA